MKKRIKFLTVLFSFTFTLIIYGITSYADLLLNNTFDNEIGLPWHTCETAPARSSFEIKNGKYYVKVLNCGVDRWGLQLRYRGLTLVKDHKYNVKFSVKADKDSEIYARIGDEKDPYFEDWNIGRIDGKNDWQPRKLKANEEFIVEESFVSTRDAKSIEFAFQIGGPNVINGTTFEFDNIYFEDTNSTLLNATPTITPSPKLIRINQVGYYPELAKIATYKTDSKEVKDWSLIDSNGKVVLNGKTKLYGFDKDSGDNVQQIDFSFYKKSGKDYKLIVDNEESQLFNIATDIYSKLTKDSLKYFYYHRSGVPITMPFCESKEWEREAWHNPDVLKSYTGYYTYGVEDDKHTLDVTGGWYDLYGEYGKYSANSGAAVWLLQNQVERNLYFKNSNKANKNSVLLNIPESNNNIPDVLDEARVQIEFMQKLQIPEGFKYSGMVHFAALNLKKSDLAIIPNKDSSRYLIPPTTASTLTLAATGAQASRLWKEYDPDFSEKCLKSAEIAWNAAIKNPNMKKQADEAVGTLFGEFINDEFYWAACELYITTGNTKYYDYIKLSEYFLYIEDDLYDSLETVAVDTSFDYEYTSSFGTLSLSLFLDKLSEIETSKIKKNIVSMADRYISMTNLQGYGIPFNQSGYTNYYIKGSNGHILANSTILAYAHDITGEQKYINGIVSSLDYILGRNPLDISYVTGYGKNSVQNPHHNFFAYQANADFPKAPSGFLVGGPSTYKLDYWIRGSGIKEDNKTPQKSYIDNINSWSTNSCFSLYNASLSWVAGYLDGIQSVTLGDIDGNGKINSTDVALATRHVLGLIELTGNKFISGDVNKDDRISSTDIAKIEFYIMNKIQSL